MKMGAAQAPRALIYGLSSCPLPRLAHSESIACVYIVSLSGGLWWVFYLTPPSEAALNASFT